MARVGEARLCGEGAALQRLPSRRTWTWFGGSAAAAAAMEEAVIVEEAAMVEVVEAALDGVVYVRVVV